MKQINRLIQSTVLTHVRGAFLAGLVGLAVIALAGSAFFTPARAAGGGHDRDDDGQSSSDEAGVLLLLSDYHGALAYGGNADAMASLWVEDSSLTLNNGTPYVGKAAVLNFFVTGPYFTHNWVSLAPEWKTTLSVHGNRAEATTECIATDVTVTPNVVRGVIQVNATCERRHGKWLFTHMDNVTLPEL